MRKLLFTLALIIQSLSADDNANVDDLNVEKVLAAVYRQISFDENSDDLLMSYANLDYFLCESTGTTAAYLDGVIQGDLVDNFRSQFIFAVRDTDWDNDQSGMLAVSAPDIAGSLWVVASLNAIKEKDYWIDVWDSKFNVGDFNFPLIDSFKGTVNDFILRVDLDMQEEENWEQVDGILVTPVSREAVVSMNRGNLNYYEEQIETKLAKIQDFSFSFELVKKAEGSCTNIER